jgi:TAT (twin-arginine translocation) pathway-exported protein
MGRGHSRSRREFLKTGLAAAAASSLPAFGAARDLGMLTLPNSVSAGEFSGRWPKKSVIM